MHRQYLDGRINLYHSVFYLHLSISNGFVSSKIYDKRDDFDFDIVNFPFFGWRCSSSPLPSSVYFSTYNIC